MATMKAKKGNPFEYDTMYNFIEDRYELLRPDTNIKGIDIIVKDKDNDKYIFIECKNRNLSWNELKQIYDSNISVVRKVINSYLIDNFDYYIVYKPKRSEVLVFYCDDKVKRYISSFENIFKRKFNKRPKGYSINKLYVKKLKGE